MVLWTLKNKEECDFFFSLFYYSEILHYRSKNKYLRNKFDSTAECSFSSDCSVYPSALDLHFITMSVLKTHKLSLDHSN